MKNKIIGDWLSEETVRINREISGQMYFTRPTKLLELKRTRKQTTKKSGLKVKQMMMFAMVLAFVAPLALGGCSSTQNSKSSSYEKSKSGSEKGRASSTGGYY